MPATTKNLNSAATAPVTAEGDHQGFTRLHISPLDAALLKVVLPPSLLPKARNISFHTIETFPEKRYGFVELPQMEAEKLKKKLNGTTLKGSKLKVDKARPENRPEPEDTGSPEAEKRKKSAEDGGSERKKRRKREIDVLEGVAIKDRKVKRGWTETPDEARKKAKKSRETKEKERREKKDKKRKGEEAPGEDAEEPEKASKKDKSASRKRTKSKYTEEEECLLKTKVPPNALKNVSVTDLPTKRRKKDKSREVTVHEFEKTTKFPSFLKGTTSATDSPAAVEFQEGKGWVDAEGNVVEAVKEKKKTSKAKIVKPPKSKPVEVTPAEAADSDDETSSSGSSEEDEDDETSDSDSSDAEESSASAGAATPDSQSKGRPMSSSSSRSLTIKIPPPITPSATKVHPLEALYKRSKPEGQVTETPEPAQPFSFFGGDGADAVEDAPAADTSSLAVPSMPMTPYTRQDFEWRNVRSAAPTPDTAHPSRQRNFWAPPEKDSDEDLELPTAGGPGEDDVPMYDEEDDAAAATTTAGAAAGADDDGDDEAAGSKAEAGSSAAGKSDFQNWFWENRGQLNKSWMKRKKDSAKAKRHRENKARTSRAV